MFCSTLSRSATLSNRHMNLPTLGKLTHGNSKQDDSYSPVGGSPVRPSIERISHPRQPVAQAAHSLLLTSPQLNWLAMYVPSPYHTIPVTSVLWMFALSPIHLLWCLYNTSDRFIHVFAFPVSVQPPSKLGQTQITIVELCPANLHGQPLF